VVLTRSARYSLSLALGYAVVAGAWIVLSGKLAATVASSTLELQHLDDLKGGLFVVTTAIGLFVACKLVMDRLERSASELLRHERTLVANERRVFAGLMASSVAHDANNVLMGITSDLGELVEEPETAPSTLARLHKSVERLIALNRRLVQVARHTATAQRQSLELTAAVKEAVELARSHPSVRQAKVSCVGEPVTISAHPLLISQIVTNLVINAGEATNGRGTIEVSVCVRDGEVLLQVDDDGPGVPALARPTLFEALATSKPEGNGMGLFSVRACALSLGGRAEVGESAKGGASFRVHIPLGTS
jgi:signal transduction histidine kinase